MIDVLEPNAISIIPSITDALCNGETGSVTLSITGGTPPYNENWGSNNPDALLAGTYTVTVTDDAGCEETSPVTISEPTALAVDQANTVIFDVTCFGASDGTITVVATGGSSPYSYDWGTTDPNALAAGNYNVTITDANGCIITESFIVNEPSPLIANATITDPLCYGETGSVVLTITGGTPPYTEDWGTADPNALAAGFYTVTITDATGCYLVNTITVSDPPELTVSVSTTAATDGTTADGTATATATGGTMPVSYAWSNGENTQMISNLLPDVYCVTVTDANACTASVCDTVEFSISIAEQSGSELVIYPNPTDGLLNIKATSTINEIKIVNILGKTIETIHSGEKTTIIDLRSKAKGIYFIEITGNGFSNTERVILK
ncbi:MAG: hypothetical protein C0594_16115 [Marinilabiliales bacterium]|nr:MAG: hypothetical protein C0594_16115 [Marinilabiliales bacterium]